MEADIKCTDEPTLGTQKLYQHHLNDLSQVEDFVTLLNARIAVEEHCKSFRMEEAQNKLFLIPRNPLA